MLQPWYCTREDVKTALDMVASARSNSQIDSAIESSTRGIEDQMLRTFYPWQGTKYFNWPVGDARSWVLYLRQNDAISVSSLSSGGVLLTNFFLEPVNDGPPYTRIELNISTSAAFRVGATHQRDVTAVGLWGYRNDELLMGAISGAINDSVTTIAVNSSANVGVGSLIRVDAERMLVQSRSMVTTGQILQTPIGASSSEVLLAVTNGALYSVGEVVLLDAEKMFITDIAGNSLIVKRSWDGSVLATHTGSTIYAPRSLSVTRGAVGTTAASHLDTAAYYEWQPPGLIHELAIAESVNTLLQKTAGYSRKVGTADNVKMKTGDGIQDIRDRAYNAHGRKLVGVGAI
jgi:hypothetical protein